MDPKTREQRERDAFDRQLEGLVLMNGDLLISQADVERYRHPWVVRRSTLDLLFKILGDVKGLTVLDIGCGDGFWTSMLGVLGARVTGIDVSERYVQVAARRVQVNGVEDRVVCLQASAHELPFGPASFDVVFGNQILHHLDTNLASREIHRVLRPGGRAVLLEPVVFSPLLRRIRKTAFVMAIVKSSRVSPDEEPLSRVQIDEMSAPFSTVRIREVQMLSRLGRVLGSGKLLWILNDIDNKLFELIPYLHRFARSAVIELVK